MAFIPGSFTPKGSAMFTASQNWQVPAGIHKIKMLIVSGGGGGGGGYSTTYTGGGGGSGAVAYAEALVVPGWVLSIIVGAGGAGGSGGASPTSGGFGGLSAVEDPDGNYMIAAEGGVGGGAATGSANGANGGGGTLWVNLAEEIISSFGLDGNNGLYTAPSPAPILPLGAVASTSGIQTLKYASVGAGGAGGAVNSNGSPGTAGMVIIWWGD